MRIGPGWEEIALLVNSVGMGTTRDGNDVKKKFTDLKYKVKKKAALIKNSISKTGGGSPQKIVLKEIEEKVIELIGKTCNEGATPLSHDLTAVQINKLHKPDAENEVHLSENINHKSKKAKSITSVNGKNTSKENIPVPIDVDSCYIEEEEIANEDYTDEHIKETPQSSTPNVWYLGSSKDGSSRERVQKSRKRLYRKEKSIDDNTLSEALDVQIKTYNSTKAIEEENRNISRKLDTLIEAVLESTECMKSVNQNLAVLTEMIARKNGFDFEITENI